MTVTVTDLQKKIYCWDCLLFAGNKVVETGNLRTLHSDLLKLLNVLLDAKTCDQLNNQGNIQMQNGFRVLVNITGE